MAGTTFGRTIRIKERTKWEFVKEATFQQDWGRLRTLGNSKVVRSNMLWIFLIPLLVKLIDFIHKHHEQFGSLGIIIQGLQLPFSWVLLYFTSLFFALGSLIFIARCPRLIKETGNFGEFTMQGKSDIEIQKLFFDHLNYHERENSIQVPDTIGSKFKLQEFLEFTTGSKENRPAVAHLDIENLLDTIYKETTIVHRSEAFKMMWDELRCLYPYVRTACSIFYILGFIFLSIIFGQNAYAFFNFVLEN